MSVAAIYQALAKEFSISKNEVGYAFESLAAGLRPAYLAHFRRAEVGNLSEGSLRRMDRMRRHFEDVDARRANVLKTLKDDDQEADRKAVEGAIHRWELDNLLVAMRKPEPEVQLALDRGLGGLAEQLLEAPSGDEPVYEAPQRSKKEGKGSSKPAAEAEEQGQDAKDPMDAKHPGDPGAAADEAAAPEAAASSEENAAAEAAPEAASAETDAGGLSDDEPTAGVAADAEGSGAEAAEAAASSSDQAVEAQVDADTTEAAPSASDENETAASEPAANAGGAPVASAAGKAGKDDKKASNEDKKDPAFAPTKVAFTAELARLCQPFVNPDRDLHSDEAALEGALRILSDRLGRDVKLRASLRRIALKHAKLSVRPLGDEKKLARAKALLRLNTTLNQLQGHRLLSLRQALIQRQVALVIRLDPSLALPKVHAALGKRLKAVYGSVFEAVAERAFWRRLVPFLEEEVKHELRERADDEATRFLSQSLRHVLLAPLYGPRPVAGVDVNPKGDWTVVLLDGDGNALGEEHKLEAASLELGKLAEALSEPLRAHGIRALAVGNGKGARDAVRKLREVIALLGADAMVFPVNESGLSSYANSEVARQELGERSVPVRMAISLGRRLQNPLYELLKTDVRHLGLGREQGIVSKANLRRLTAESVESCVAFVGCDVNHAPLHVLRHVPGLDFETAKRIVDRRAEKPFAAREELRAEGILDGVRWTNAAGFLLIGDGPEPLERATVHPDHYELARQACEAVGSSPADAVGRFELFRKRIPTPEGTSEDTWRDLTRSLGRGGRDGRSRLYHPRLLAPDTESVEKGAIVEGIVSNVTSFGVFVDIGIPRDGMVHISELSARYVRDARELLSVGQIVRARVLDGTGQRVELSLKNVPDEKRERRGGRGSRPAGDGSRREGRGEGGGRRRRGEGKEAWPEYQPVVRAARTRRDGLAGAGSGRPERRGGGKRGGGPGGSGGSGGRGGSGGQGGGRGRGAGRGGPRDGRRGRDESYDAEAVKKVKGTDGGSYNPFANFFKDREAESSS